MTLHFNDIEKEEKVYKHNNANHTISLSTQFSIERHKTHCQNISFFMQNFQNDFIFFIFKKPIYFVKTHEAQISGTRLYKNQD